jgi:protocatechuate 3,4-dioxygenase beta subunit
MPNRFALLWISLTLLLATGHVIGCSSQNDPPQEQGKPANEPRPPSSHAQTTRSPYEQAVRACRESDVETAMTRLIVALQDDPDACQRALLEPAFQTGLRDTREFRRAVHDAAIEHGLSHMQLVARDEPGQWITVEGTVVDPDGHPLPGAQVHIFATDADGIYHPRIEGESTPRIFGSVLTDEQGRFTVDTVLPGPYPGTRNPRHLHVMVRQDDLRLAAPGYIVFDDDPLLYEAGNEEPRGEALRIAMHTREDGRRVGMVELPVR